jgi:hypothetical protein
MPLQTAFVRVRNERARNKSWINLAGATGLEPDRGGFHNLLMARDFRHKSLRMRCLVPVFDSPGVPSSPLESSAVLETFWNGGQDSSPRVWVALVRRSIASTNLACSRSSKQCACSASLERCPVQARSQRGNVVITSWLKRASTGGWSLGFRSTDVTPWNAASPT